MRNSDYRQLKKTTMRRKAATFVLAELVILFCISPGIGFSNNVVFQSFCSTIFTRANNQIIQVKGKIVFGKDNRICILQDKQSKSRKCYYVFGPLVEALTKHVGEIVTLQGIIINQPAPWVVNIAVDEILSWENNNKLENKP